MQSLSFGFKFKQPLYLAGTMLLAGMTLAGCGGKSDIAAGGAHTVVYQQGQLYTWGRNTNNQLAIDSQGQLYTWGDNDNGQLGVNPEEVSSRYEPELIEGLEQAVTAIAAGKDHAVVLLQDGSMRAWGLNRSGQLGIGTQENAYQPAMVNTSALMKSISASGNFNLAISTDQKLYSWGQNLAGSLGTGRADNESAPVLVDAFSQPVINAVNGLGHSIVTTVEEDGSKAFWTFGLNSFGQIGVADAPFRNLTPLRIVFSSQEK